MAAILQRKTAELFERLHLDLFQQKKKKKKKNINQTELKSDLD